MATRFYFTGSPAPYTPPTRRGAWDVTSSTSLLIDTTKAGTATQPTGSIGTTAANHDRLFGQFVSPAFLSGGTLSGTVQWIMGVYESNAGENLFFHMHIFVTAGDTDTVRGTVLTDFIGTTEFGTNSNAAGNGDGAITLTSITVQAGDRLVCEIGCRTVPSSSSANYNWKWTYGGTGSTDLTQGNSSSTSRPGWVEFSDADPLYVAGGGGSADTSSFFAFF